MPGPRFFAQIAAAQAFLQVTVAAGGGSGWLRGLASKEPSNKSDESKINAYADEPDPNCSRHISCTGGGKIPLDRGVCVQPLNTTSASDRMCYDICNEEHDESEYGTGVIDEKWGIAYKVYKARNNIVTRAQYTYWACPRCDPGDRCTDEDWEEDRGMCVRNHHTDHRGECRDMCDKSINATMFGIDTKSHREKGTPIFVNTSLVNIVKKVRAGHDYVKCPEDGYPWWLWVLLALLILCLCCCCILCLLLCCRKKKEEEKEAPPEETAYTALAEPEEEVKEKEEETVPEPTPPPPPAPEPVAPPPEQPAPFINICFENEDGGTESKDFYKKPLGFAYEWSFGMPVNKVHEGSEADRLGVKLGWKMAKVDGWETPFRSNVTKHDLKEEIRIFTNSFKDKVDGTLPHQGPE